MKKINKNKLVISFLSFIYSFLLVFGFSYDKRGDATLIFGSISSFLLSSLIFFLFYIAFKFIIKKIFKFIDNYKYVKKDGKIIKFKDVFERHPFATSMVIMLICWLPYIICFYPIIMSPDPSFQIKQFFGIDNKYSYYVNLLDPNVIITNHHPVLHTLLLGSCLKIGVLINNHNLGLFLYSFIQILILSSTFSYSIKYLNKINIPFKFKFLVLIVYSLVPMFPFYSMSAVKDVIFSSLVILYTISIYDLFRNKNNHISNIKYLYLFILMVLLVLFRNNGIHMILLSFPMLIWLMKNKLKKLIVLFISILAFNVSYNDFILPFFKITPGSVREKLSIPFQQTARFVKYNEELLSADDKKKIDKILDISNLGKRYDPKLSDPVKEKFNPNATSQDLKDYFGVWFNCFFQDPALYVDATINNVYGYFYPLTSKWYIYRTYDSRITRDGFNYHFIREFSGERNVLGKFGEKFPQIPIVGLISNIGFNVWMLFLLTGYLIYKNKEKGLIILLPNLVLLLVCIASPANTYFRYAMPYVFAMPIMICLVLNYIKSSEE